jgi:hypothetical protein
MNHSTQQITVKVQSNSTIKWKTTGLSKEGAVHFLMTTVRNLFFLKIIRDYGPQEN